MHLLSALPVDLEQHVGAGAHLFFDPHARSGVVVAVYLGPFEKLAAITTSLELLDGHEVVLAAVLLARTRLARRS